VFPFATRVFLRLLDGQDVAVSFASAFFSILAIWLTYILGAAVWSRPVGLVAALGLSLDHDVIALASLGWRDDAYMAAVALCAYLMLRCWRAGQGPGRVRCLGRLRFDAAYLEAAAMGVASGFAVLTRIMAVPFLAVGAVFLLFALRAWWRRRLTMVGIAVVTALVAAGPYFVNCWRVYGDPLYTFNVHGSIYSVAEGQEKWRDSTATYVGQKIVSRPIEMLDTVVQGLTTYPFTNKWHGLDRWHSGLGDWASTAAIVGLVVLAASASGRLLLVAMLASLVPFAFTWKVDPDFRFTEFVYPVLLISAAIALDAGFRAVRAVLVPCRAGEEPVRWGTSWLAWASVVGVGVAALWFVARVSPPWVFAETLRARESAMVTAGARDSAFFDRGWSEVMRGGNVSMRVATAEGSLSVRLPSVDDYPVTLRMDPFPRPLDDTPQRLPVVDVAINGTPLGVVTLRWTAERVGAYDIVLPRALVRRGVNHLVLHVRRPTTSTPAAIQPGLSDGDALGLWYVRVHPGVHE
jgi:4-amino-4-deoxy-L-arabinose transferase-like glycosyltransferase